MVSLVRALQFHLFSISADLKYPGRTRGLVASPGDQISLGQCIRIQITAVLPKAQIKYLFPEDLKVGWEGELFREVVDLDLTNTSLP